MVKGPMVALFIASVSLIAWVYLVYPLLLCLGALLVGRRKVAERLPENRADWPVVSVIIAVFNEERVIRRRIDNLLALDYPAAKLEIMIASDGSTDSTTQIARSFADPRITVLDFKENRGREAVHSDAIPQARGDLVVTTDADTTFDIQFVQHCAAALSADPRLGCVVGNLSYRTIESSVSQFEGIYWRYDTAIKRWESDLHLIHNGSGPCQAIRRDLFRPLRARDDVDATTILDILLQGFRVKFLPTALAFDVPPASTAAELKGRIRQTSRSFVSGVRKWHPGLWPRHPLLTISYLSHRLLRWLSPYFFLLALVSNAFILDRGTFFVFTFVVQLAAYGAALAGWALEAAQAKPVPVLSSLFGFGVANVGMFIGVIKGLSGRAPRGYQMPADPELVD